MGQPLDAYHMLLFGDQTVEPYPLVWEVVSEAKKSLLLRTFLQNVTDALQIEVATLDPTERASFREFTSVIQLAEYYREVDDELGIAHGVLICVARIGKLILQAEANPDILGPSDKDVVALGFCAGLLPAAVAAACRSAADIIDIGIVVVTISCRLATEISRRSRMIEPAPGCWGYSMIGVSLKDLEACLGLFHRAKRIPDHRRVYVGVTASGWLTIFGPPSVLANLFAFSHLLSETPKLQLRAYGAVHATHLPMPELYPLLGRSPLLSTPLSSHFKIISSSRCAPFTAPDLRSLLLEMMDDILRNTLDMKGMIEASISSISMQKGRSINLHVLGSTPHQSLVQSILKDHGIEATTLDHASRQPKPELRGGSDLIAIVGMSGRFPGSDSVSDFWKSLLDAQDFHKPIPSDRYDVQTYLDTTATLQNSTSVPYGCFLDHPGYFDARLFNISPREALQMEPIQRMLLMVSYEALQVAGYTGNGTASTNSKRISTYFGQSADDWRDINHNQGIDIYYVPGLARAFAPARLNYHYKWEGASYAVDSACASSTTALGLACDALINRDCDTALAGGGNTICSPDTYAGLSRGGFLSKTGGSKTFSKNADGYCRGEGVGVVVLKRLEDALHENDNVLAVISGHGRNHSAHAHSITHPHAETQERLYKQVLQRAGIEAIQIGYVEMHGTGTTAGDLTEMTSVTNVLGKGRTKQTPLILGAVKANIGHGEAFAGIASLIKSIMILKEGIVPPQPGASFPIEPRFPNLGEMNIQIPDKVTPLRCPTRGDGKRRILLNNFDAAGGNAAFVIEEATAPPIKEKSDPRTHHVVTISARTTRSLRGNKERLLEHLLANPDVCLADLAYTSTARRIHEVLKVAYLGKSTQEIATKIRDDLATSQTKKSNTGKQQNTDSEPAGVVFVFMGQGSHYAGMGRALFHTSPTFKAYILSLDKLCASHGLPSFLGLIANSDININSFTTVQVQLAIVALELALTNLLQSWGIQPSLLIGHSLGEYSALCVSGVLSISDTLYLVGKRASIIQDKCSPGAYAMIAINSSRESAEGLLLSSGLSSCHIACDNGPNATVVSGTVRDVHALQSQLQAEGIPCKILPVPFGFHSAQLDPVLSEYEAVAEGIHFGRPEIPIASTMEGVIVRNEGIFNASYLTKQAREPVCFVKALQAGKESGLIGKQGAFIEIGPVPVGPGLIRSNPAIKPSLLLPLIRSNESNWETITNTLAALYQADFKVDWAEFHKPYVQSLTLIQIPTYQFDTKDYWVTYTPEAVAAAANIYSLQSGPAKSNNSPSQQILSACLQYVDNDSLSSNQPTVSFSSQTSERNLSAAIANHVIAGVAICPSGVFCDMVYSAAKYIWESTKPGSGVFSLSLCNLEMNHPVIFSSKTPEQLILTTATQESAELLKFSFSCKKTPTSSAYDVGECQAKFVDAAQWRSDWEKTAYFVKLRADALIQSVRSGNGHRLMKPIVYKLFSSLVEYGPNYRGIQEAYLTDDFQEGVAIVKLSDDTGAGIFVLSPYWTDPLVQLAGFMLNGNVAKPDDTAYIATRIECFHIGEALSPEKSYTSYVKIQNSQKKDWATADVYVFENDRIVALCSGLKFQRMSKTVLDHILGKSDSKAEGPLSGTRYPLEKSSIKEDIANRPERSGPSSNLLGEVNYNQEAKLEEVLLAAVAAETGVELDEMDNSMKFADIGVDSMMSIAIISSIKKNTGIDLGASFFTQHPTVAHIREALWEDAGEIDGDPEANSNHSATSESNWNPFDVIHKESTLPPFSEEEPSTRSEVSKTSWQMVEAETPKKHFSEYTSNVVLLQGRASAKQTPLFLICDGAGSAAAYIHLPIFGNGMEVYALESPFLNCPSEYTTTVEESAQIYVSSLRKVQPQGPYIIGGWSAGAVFAYEVSRLLLEAGQTVLGLIIIDMRVPRPMPDLEAPMRDVLENVGLVTGINRTHKMPSEYSERLKKHLLGCIKSLMHYDPLPMHRDRRPNYTTIIWATLSIAEVATEDVLKAFHSLGWKEEVAGNVMEDEGTGVQAWFFSKRKSFGANGWDALLGEVECHTMEADHFSMLSPPRVKILGKIMKDAIAKFTK